MQDPAQTFPRAMFAAVITVVLGYLIPVLMGLGIWGGEDWPDGFFATLGKKVGGRFLEAWITLAAVGSQIGLFEAEMSSDSFQVLGMAERGMLPKRLGIRSKYGTPTIGILMSASGVAVMSMTFEFEKVVEFLNYAYCLAVLLEFAAFIYLRIKAPYISRPYRVPLSTRGVILMLLPATLLSSMIIIVPWVQRKYDIIGFSIGVVVTGVFVHLFTEHARNKEWFKFSKFEPYDYEAFLQATEDDKEEGDNMKLLQKDRDDSSIKT